MPTWGSLYFQNASSPVMEQLIFFHDHTMIVLVLVTILVGYLLMGSVYNKNYNRGMFGGQELESIWTILPAIFLLVIALPSLKLLYLMEEMDNPDLTIKAVGRQWYWEYEYADLDLSMFEAYMIPSTFNPIFRLMEVDNFLCMPLEVGIRVVVTSGDVIHSWTVPSLGVKADGIPGRLNQMLMYINKPGIFVGQCSEICGANHSFMPIVLSAVSKKDFLNSMS